MLLMPGMMRLYTLPKKDKAREKNDNTITVHALEGPLREYMRRMGHRNVWQMLEPLASLQYNSGTPHSILRDFAPLASLYVQVCRKGILPSLKHRQALQKLNAENVIGQGKLRINFTDLSDEVFVDQIDDRIRVLLKHFRICVSNSIGVQKQRRLYANLEPQAYDLVSQVFAEFSDVTCVTAPVANGTLAIEDTPTPAMQLAQQAVDSQDSMACDDLNGSSESTSLAMPLPPMPLSVSSWGDTGYTVDAIADGSAYGTLAGGTLANEPSDATSAGDASDGATSAKYSPDAIVDSSANGPSGVTSAGGPSDVTSASDPSAVTSAGGISNGAGIEWFGDFFLTAADAQMMMDSLEEGPKFQEESHNSICIKNMQERKGKRKKKAKNNDSTRSTTDGQKKKASKKKKAATQDVDDATCVTDTTSSTTDGQKKKASKKKKAATQHVDEPSGATTTSSTDVWPPVVKGVSEYTVCGLAKNLWVKKLIVADDKKPVRQRVGALPVVYSKVLLPPGVTKLNMRHFYTEEQIAYRKNYASICYAQARKAALQMGCSDQVALQAAQLVHQETVLRYDMGNTFLRDVLKYTTTEAEDVWRY